MIDRISAYAFHGISYENISAQYPIAQFAHCVGSLFVSAESHVAERCELIGPFLILVSAEQVVDEMFQVHKVRQWKGFACPHLQIFSDGIVIVMIIGFD